MYEGPVAEGHHLVHSRDLIFSELMIEKLLPYTWVCFRYHIQVYHDVNPLILYGEVEDVEPLFKGVGG